MSTPGGRHYRGPVPLGSGHRLDAFRSRSAEQTTWLREHARRAGSEGTARTFVVTTTADDTHVVAYYAWRIATIVDVSAGGELHRDTPRAPQPTAVLTRLGVDAQHERQGLGAALVGDVVLRLLAAADGVACRVLLIHCESGDARSFCRHLLPELEPSPTDPLHLVLRVKDVERSLR